MDRTDPDPQHWFLGNAADNQKQKGKILYSKNLFEKLCDTITWSDLDLNPDQEPKPEQVVSVPQLCLEGLIIGRLQNTELAATLVTYYQR
jgi:hypothetical protein